MGRGAGTTTRTAAVGAMALLALVGAGTGCGSSGSDAGPAPSDTEPATTVPAPSAWVVPTPAELGIEVCATARAPVFIQRTDYGQGTTTSGLEPPADATSLTGVEPPADPVLSLNARTFSNPHLPADDTGAITVAHPTGEPTVLGGVGMVVGWPGGRTWIGDLDGDGTDEIAVISTRPGGSTSPADGGMPVVIVPGTVAAGLQDPFAVGITLPVDGAQGQGVYGVGDIDGDGADDVLVPDPSEASSAPVVVSGRDLMAPGAGAELGEVPTPIAELDPAWFGASTVSGLLTLSPGTDPVAGTLGPDGLALGTEPALLLARTESADVTGGGGASGPGSTLTAYRSDGHRIVVLHTDTGRSGVTVTEMWDLDAPCPA